MRKFHTKLLSASIIVAAGFSVAGVSADAFTDAVTGGKAFGDFRLRYESVDQDNALDNASALTLRSRIGYITGELEGFSATVEFEDNRIVGGVGDYAVVPTGYNVGQYSVIADPEHTELDQGFIQYNAGTFTARLGRQVISYDNHRFVGHVGWRQDRQTYDGLTLSYAPMEKLTLSYAYVSQVNGIFAEETDAETQNHFFNAAYASPIGKIVAYSYLIDYVDGPQSERDTFGVSLNGSVPAGEVKLLYTAELASQSFDGAGAESDTDYTLLEGGVAVAGITAKFGYEVLGSDDGMASFQTPLATLHKFNGWADQFIVGGTPAGGLVDTYASVGGSLAGGSWAVIYHEYSADEDSPGMEDYGDEWNMVYSRKFAKNYNAGIKYAAYSADDYKVDSDILWLWVGMSF